MKQVLETIQKEFEALNHSVATSLYTDVELVDDIGQYIIDAGGKRIRPILVLLCSKALNHYNEDSITLATIIEYIHTATLLHDDVVDLSSMRRGRETANEKWGNAPAVLVGDFIYSRAFELLVKIGHMDIMALMAETTNRIAAGEVLQLAKAGSSDTSKTTYFDIIERKTAILFEAACKGAAILANTQTTTQNALADYGKKVGVAFQLTDDYLDYTGDSETMGKNMGDDLAEGKTTLPLIIAMQQLSAADSRIIATAIENKDIDQIDTVCQLIKQTQALEQTLEIALSYANNAKAALECLPISPYKAMLERIADLSVKRAS